MTDQQTIVTNAREVTNTYTLDRLAVAERYESVTFVWHNRDAYCRVSRPSHPPTWFHVDIPAAADEVFGIILGAAGRSVSGGET